MCKLENVFKPRLGIWLSHRLCLTNGDSRYCLKGTGFKKGSRLMYMVVGCPDGHEDHGDREGALYWVRVIWRGRGQWPRGWSSTFAAQKQPGNNVCMKWLLASKEKSHSLLSLFKCLCDTQGSTPVALGRVCLKRLLMCLSRERDRT